MKLFDVIVQHKRFYAIIVFLLLLFTAFRFIYINADAPGDITFSAATFTDEGFKTYAARNKVVFGNWKWSPDEQYESWLKKSPLSTWTYVKAFQLFGANIFSIRLISVLYSAATMLLLFVFLLRRFDRKTALLGLILFGSNYFSIIYNRMGFFETHLNFYLMLAVLGIAEAFSANNKIILRITSLVLGSFSIFMAFNIKVSFIVAFIAMLPALILMLVSKRDTAGLQLNRLFVIITSGIAFIYITLAYLGPLTKKIQLLFNKKVFGSFVIKTFDPVHVAFGKAFHQEFIIVQPIVFLLGLFFARYTFYSFIIKRQQKITDLFLSSWLLFGFLILNLMSYHPARYFHMLTIPIVALAARMLLQNSVVEYQSFLESKQKFPFNMMKLLLFIGILINAGMVVIENILPFSFKALFSRKLYSYFLLVHGKVHGSLQSSGLFWFIFVMAILFLLYFFIMIFLIVKRKKIIAKISQINFQKVCISAIIILQMFLFGKWIFTHTHSLYNTSVKLEKILPDNSILFGSWSAGLVMNNRFRSIILQQDCWYNRKLIAKLIAGKEIPVYKKINGRIKLLSEKNQPLYLAVSPKLIFEKHIAKLYKKYISPERLVMKRAFGFFDVEIYRVR